MNSGWTNLRNKKKGIHRTWSRSVNMVRIGLMCGSKWNPNVPHYETTNHIFEQSRCIPKMRPHIAVIGVYKTKETECAHWGHSVTHTWSQDVWTHVWKATLIIKMGCSSGRRGKHSVKRASPLYYPLHFTVHRPDPFVLT